MSKGLDTEKVLDDVTQSYPDSALPAWFWDLKDIFTIIVGCGTLCVAAVTLLRYWGGGQS